MSTKKTDFISEELNQVKQLVDVKVRGDSIFTRESIPFVTKCTPHNHIYYLAEGLGGRPMNNSTALIYNSPRVKGTFLIQLLIYFIWIESINSLDKINENRSTDLIVIKKKYENNSTTPRDDSFTNVETEGVADVITELTPTKNPNGNKSQTIYRSKTSVFSDKCVMKSNTLRKLSKIHNYTSFFEESSVEGEEQSKSEVILETLYSCFLFYSIH